MSASAEPTNREPNAPVWLKIFVALHVFAITVWALPNPSDDILEGKRPATGSEPILVANHSHLKPLPPVRAYMFATGFWQYWDMFAPNPTQTDFFGTAEIEYADGTKTTYRYPRVSDLPVHRKYVTERYRKFFERAHLEKNRVLWPAFAQAVALLNLKDPANPPVRVRLWRHWSRVPPPDAPQVRSTQEYMFFDYTVDQAELARDLPR